MLFAYIVVRITKLRVIPKQQSFDKKFLSDLFEFFKDSRLVKMYILCGSASVWWAVIFIYVPMYIVSNGLPYSYIGYFIFATAVPLVLFEAKIGESINSQTFHRFYIIAFSILGSIALICHFTSNVYITLALLVIGSFGVMFLEPMREIYFFTVVPLTKAEKYYGTFKASNDTGILFGKIMGALVLTFLAFNYIFFFLAIIMFILLGLSFSINRVHKCRKI
jgi:predicted MFS family arabinose efflux permease